jgi:hypothetical protein
MRSEPGNTIHPDGWLRDIQICALWAQQRGHDTWPLHSSHSE